MTNESNSIELLSDRDLQKSAPKPVRPLAEDHGHIHEDNAFLGALSLRMKDADWNQYERGSEAFLDIDRDLEKLAKSSPTTASDLWKENAPKGMKLPHYLASELEQQTQETAREESKPIAQKMDHGDGYEIPGAIKKRYLETEGKFHFRDGQNGLAFEDRGRRVVTEHNDPAIAASMVELAEAKGWNKIKVAGHDDFKREVWLQASLKNIEVTGYKPKDVDLAKLEELRGSRMKNAIEPAYGAAKVKAAEPTRQTTRSEKTDQSRNEVETKPVKTTGQLLEHGEAPYDFDKTNNPSYFVKIKTAEGTKMHWGTDLGDALAASGAKVGEKIDLERGTSDKSSAPTQNWRVDIAGTRREPEHAEPQLKGDHKVAAVVMAEVLKDKGYSAKTIDKALQEATKRLSEMDKTGTPAPRVKVFDKNAPRAIERPKVQSRSQQREAERTR